jgi:hypothetical protein
VAQRLATKITPAVRQLARWYLTPTGGLVAVAVIVGAVLAATVSLPVGLLVVVAVGAVVVPYRLMRLEHGRLEVLDAVSAVGQSVAAAEEEIDRVRRAVLAEVEIRGNANAELAERLETRDRDVEALRAELVEQRDAYEATLNLHRSRFTLELARRDGRSLPVRRVILLVCAQRVGSTWLFDLLRQHPEIDVHPTADIFRRLAVAGRRYPIHLTDVVETGLDIEVGDGVGGVIPSFQTALPPKPDGDGRNADPYYIEKLHPSFIAFDVDGFAGRVAALRAELGGDDRVVTIYPIREPSESIRSFMSYRSRNPNWSQDVPLPLLHEFYRRTFEALAALRERLPGPVVTYEDMTRDPAGTVATLLRRVGVRPVDERQVADYVHATATHKDGSASAFFSSGDDKPGVVDVELGTGSDDPARARESLARCRVLYRVLVDAGTSRATTGAD